MRTKFLSNLFLLLLLNLVVKPLWLLGVDREVQNTLGSEVYGTYFALLNFSILFSSLLDLGVSAYNNRNIAQHHFLLSKYFPKLIHIKLALACLYFVLMCGAGYLLGYNGLMFKMLLLLAFNQIILSLILFFRSNLGALLLFKKDSIISVCDKVLLIGLCGGLLLYKDGQFLSLESFVGAQTLAYLITAVLAFVFLKGKIKFKKLKLKPLPYLAILKESYPYAILVLLMAIYSRTDAIMLERLLPDGAQQSGIYAQGYRILEAFSMIAYLFSTLLLPLFAKMLKDKSPISDLLKVALKLLGVFSLSVAVLCSVFSSDLVDILYKYNQQEASVVLGLLIFSLIPISITYIFGTLLTAGAKLRFLNQMAITGVLLNLILNFILIPHFKAEGAVYSTILTQGFTALIQVWACYKYFKFKLGKMLWAKIIAFPFFAAIIAYFVKSQIVGINAFFIASVLVLLLGILLGLLNPKSAISLIKTRNK